MEHLLDPATRREVEAHVEEELLEQPAGKLRSHVVTDSRPFDELVELRGPLDRVREVIAEVEFLRGEKIERWPRPRHQDRPDRCPSSCGPSAKSVVQSEAAFQHPPIRSDRKQPGEQSIEGNRLAQANERHAAIAAQGEEPRLERPAERCCQGESHGSRPASAISMSCSTRRPRPVTASRRRLGVVIPRSIACRAARTTCSGATPASATSTIVRAGAVSRSRSGRQRRSRRAAASSCAAQPRIAGRAFAGHAGRTGDLVRDDVRQPEEFERGPVRHDGVGCEAAMPP